MIAKKTRRVGSIRFGSGPFGSVRATPKSPNKTSILTLKNRQNVEQDEERNIVKFKKTPQSGDYFGVLCQKSSFFKMRFSRKGLSSLPAPINFDGKTSAVR